MIITCSIIHNISKLSTKYIKENAKNKVKLNKLF